MKKLKKLLKMGTLLGFASCRHMNLGFSRIHTCAIMYDFLSANPDINPSKIPTECNPKCEKETYELSE